ncbi:MAG: carboxypeptidase regulatory-like domain-containing protein, partial [Pyrinomonadaceae bacterium]
PAWSPDGTKIAFKSDRDIPPFRGLYVVNADGTGLTLLTNGGVNNSDSNPTWSPDGTKIAFASNRDNLISSIYIMNADGSNVMRLTNQLPVSDQTPAWSPDGTRIVFEINTGIAVINVDGTGRTNLGTGRFPAWSPDSTRIIFADITVNGNQLFVMNADGTGRTQLTNGTFNDEYPAWKSDGLKIAFIRNTSGIVKLWTMNADGSNQINITAGIANAGQGYPDWQLDVSPYRLTQSVFSNGGGNSGGGTYTVTGTTGQAIAGTNSTGEGLTPVIRSTEYSPQAESALVNTFAVSAGFWQPTFAPTAAMVSVSGRVRTSDGRGIRNVSMTVTNGIGTPRTALTSTFGYFRFDNIEAGQSYIVTVRSKRYQFSNPTQVISVSDEIADLVFTALP